MAEKRVRKSHAPADRLLAGIVQALENDREDHKKTCRSLLEGGPFQCEVMPLFELTSNDIAPLRAECLAFLRSLIGARNRDYSEGFSTTGAITFSAVALHGRVYVEAKGSVRDALVLQLIGLLQVAGVERLRLCGAQFADGRACGRLFVRTHKQENCSRTCQNRAFMRRQREAAQREIEELRLGRERAAQRRRRMERT